MDLLVDLPGYWFIIFWIFVFKKKKKKIHENVFVSGVRSSGPAVLRPL